MDARSRSWLWKLWEQVELYFKYQKKKIEFKIIELEELGRNIKIVNELNNEKEKLSVKINELYNFRKKYNDPDTIIELSKDMERLISILKDYEENVRKELPKKY